MRKVFAVVLIAVGGLVFAACGGGGTANTGAFGTPSQDSLYLGRLADNPHFTSVDPRLSVVFGRDVCASLNSGTTDAVMSSNIRTEVGNGGNGLTASDAGTVIGAAVNVYCPQYRQSIENFIAANGGG